MSHQEMDAQKAIHLTMEEVKELNFRLEHSVQETRQQVEETTEASEKTMLREKAEFLERIIAKLNR